MLSSQLVVEAHRLTRKVSIPKLHSAPGYAADLYTRLSEGTSGPLTVVRGPSAVGKTALVAAWIASDLPPGLVAWMSLDGGDDEPVAFWTLMVEALRRHGVDLPADLRPPSEPGPLHLAFLEQLWAALDHRVEPVVLVLDSFDAVTDPRVIRQLGLLLRRAAPELRLLVITRHTPPWVLGRRRLTITL